MKTFRFFEGLANETIAEIFSMVDGSNEDKESLHLAAQTDQRNHKIAREILLKKLFEKNLREAYPPNHDVFNDLKKLIDKGVSPNMTLRSGNPALSLAANWGIQLFIFLARHMTPQDLITQKDKILLIIENRLNPKSPRPYPLAMDIEKNLIDVIAYLNGKTATDLQPKDSISKERFVLLKKEIFETGFLGLAIQGSFFHPANILFINYGIRELLSPVVIYSKSQAPQQEKNEILDILEENAQITIVGDDWLTTLKLDLMANVKNVIEYFKQETFLNEDPLKLLESDFEDFSPSP